jgi:hypothetical protein
MKSKMTTRLIVHFNPSIGKSTSQIDGGRQLKRPAQCFERLVEEMPWCAFIDLKGEEMHI